MRSWGLLALACAALSLPGTAGAQAPSLAFGRCSSTQIVVPAAGLQCATLDVPFDRADPAVGSIALAVQRVPASAPRVGVIVLLAGGPGQPALPPFEALLAPLARKPALRGYEVVAFDQRGTGQSQALACPTESFVEAFHSLLKGGFSSYLGVCGAALGPTRAFYTSQESVEDLDALREALGGTPLSLFAVSYGTRVAGMYAREHPRGVARMVLDSTVPTTGPAPLGLVPLHALHRVLDEGICGSGACRSFAPDVYADLKRVVAMLHRHPLRTRVYDSRGRLRPAIVTEAGILRLLSGLDLAHGTRELAPAAIAAAAHGNAAPLARLTDGLLGEHIGNGLGPSRGWMPSPGGIVADSAPGVPLLATETPERDSAISLMLYLATYCIENQLPWSPDSAPAGRAATLRHWLASLPARATAPFLSAEVAAGSALSLCMGWPATAPAPPSPTGVSATPTLILSGVDDLRTPYEQALTIAASYSDAQLLRVPGVGHSTVSTDRTGCAQNAMIEFLTTGHAPASCRRPSEAQALPLPPPTLDQVPAASSSRLAGRVVIAAAMTLEDLFGQTTISGGGLRGGDWTMQPNGLWTLQYVLRGMRDVRGVALSGTIHMGRSTTTGPLAITAHLSVHGRLTGRLTLRGRVLSGRVGGARVQTRLAAL